VRFVGSDEATRLLREATEGEYPLREQRVDEEALKLVGLMKPTDAVGRYVRAISEEQVIGFYDDESKRLVMVNDRIEGRSLQEVTLAHELVHALEDQHFGVSTDPDLNDDRTLAEASLFEGTATALMVDYADRYFDAADALEAFGAADEGDTKLPRFLEELLVFPYLKGERFVAALRGRGNWRAVDSVIRFRRPRTTEQVLHPALFARGDAPVTPRLPGVESRLGASWKRLEGAGSGELDAMLLFKHVGEVAGADAAAGWDGGRSELWRRSGRGRCAAPCVERDVLTWALAWDTPGDRLEAERAFRRVFERGLRGRRLAVRPGVGMWSSRGGAVGLRGSRKRTLVVFAPGVREAAALLRP
jgi:hypothetical protein